MAAQRIEVFVLNHQPVMRLGLAAMVAAAPALHWAGEAADIDAALRAFDAPAAAEPDVLLLEAAPGCPLAATIAALQQRLPDLVCVLVCDDADPAAVRRAMAAGACGCWPRHAGVDDLQAAVVAAHDGRTLAVGDGSDPPPAGVDGSGLTPREGELLALLAAGLSNTEIAARLAIGLPTVKFHVAHILAKLQAENRTEAVLIALRQHLVRLD